MRVLAVAPGPGFSVHDVHTGWVEGLRELGVQVAEFNLEDRISFYANAEIKGERLQPEAATELAVNGLYSACYQFWPDLLLITSGFFTPTDMLDKIRSRGHKIALLHTEEPYQHDEGIRRAPHADVNILNDPIHLDAYTPYGPAWYQPHCYRPKLHCPGPYERRSDFCFVGTGYPSRIRFLEQVDWAGIDALLAGNWAGVADQSPLLPMLLTDRADCLDNERAVGLYRGAKVSANLYRTEANDPSLSAGWAMGPREVELAATGTFFLRDPRPESDSVLPMLPSFTSAEEFTDLLRYYLAHPAERQQRADQARLMVEQRTFVNAAKRLLQHLA